MDKNRTSSNTLEQLAMVITLTLLLMVNVKTSAQIQESRTMPVTEQTCPSLDVLHQDPIKKIWLGPGGWHSLSPSFSRTLERFVAAQWVGVGVGHIICSYTNNDRSAFVVHLQRNDLVYMPTGGSWGQNKGGYKDCIASDIHQCSYPAVTQPESKDVYEDIDFYRPSSPQPQ